MRKFMIILALLLANTAFAVPVQWTFQDVVFDDGATLTGGFVFDVDSETVVTQFSHPIEVYVQAFYFDVDVAGGYPTTPQTMDNLFFFQTGGLNYTEDYIGADLGPVWDPVTDEFNPPPPPTADPAAFQNGVTFFRQAGCGLILSDSCYLTMELDFDQPLTNAGGSVSFTGNELIWAYIDGSVYVEMSRSIVSGTLEGTTVVPVPAALWLFASALAGLGWFRRS